MNTAGFLKDIRTVYGAHADAEKALAMKKYMRDQFAFYGISKPERIILNKPLFLAFDKLDSMQKQEVLRKLWKAPQRELQYFAMEAIARKPKTWPDDIHQLFDEMILSASWWDTVDFIAVNLCGAYLKLHPEMTVMKVKTWIDSSDFWMHRTAILFQLKHKQSTDIELLFSLCRKYASVNEFFIRKAIGWALREYSKTNPSAVRRFISTTKLSPLSVKEGSKYI
jgi:3-methyladenine DNA glycosylase AlkD